MLRQDISVLLLYYLGYSRIRNLALRLKRKPVARIVLFHDLLPETLGRFEDNLYFLKRRTNVVSLDDFFSGRLSCEKINVVITFDDGFKSWVTHAIPILKKMCLPATFFVSSGFVGLSRAEETEFMRLKLFLKPSPRTMKVGLTYEDVRKIVKEGFTVGGHTLNHSNLSELRDSAQLSHEIAEDKRRLERITGGKIEYFSYPFGECQNPEIDLSKVLKESGYTGAITTTSGLNNGTSSPYLLRRELTSASMPGPVFRARVYGNYDAVRFLRQCAQAVMKRR